MLVAFEDGKHESILFVLRGAWDSATTQLGVLVSGLNPSQRGERAAASSSSPPRELLQTTDSQAND